MWCERSEIVDQPVATSTVDAVCVCVTCVCVCVCVCVFS